MRRIAVIGNTCIGKSTFAARLAHVLDCCLMDTSILYWGANWTPRPELDFVTDLKAASKADSWVTAGIYQRHFDMIFPRLDTVIWLNYSLRENLIRAIHHSWSQLRNPEIHAGENRLNWRHVLMSRYSPPLRVLRTHRKRRGMHLALKERATSAGLQTIEFKHPEEARTYLQQVQQNLTNVIAPRKAAS